MECHPWEAEDNTGAAVLALVAEEGAEEDIVAAVELVGYAQEQVPCWPSRRSSPGSGYVEGQPYLLSSEILSKYVVWCWCLRRSGLWI